MEKPRKVISGSFEYVSRVSRRYGMMGWVIVMQRQWADGTYTIAMERR